MDLTSSSANSALRRLHQHRRSFVTASIPLRRISARNSPLLLSPLHLIPSMCHLREKGEADPVGRRFKSSKKSFFLYPPFAASPGMSRKAPSGRLRVILMTLLHLEHLPPRTTKGELLKLLCTAGGTAARAGRTHRFAGSDRRHRGARRIGRPRRQGSGWG